MLQSKIFLYKAIKLCAILDFLSVFVAFLTIKKRQNCFCRCNCLIYCYLVVSAVGIITGAAWIGAA